jgi:hypothetical protein
MDETMSLLSFVFEKLKILRTRKQIKNHKKVLYECKVHLKVQKKRKIFSSIAAVTSELFMGKKQSFRTEKKSFVFE